jgi:predicted MFS family arabinose efflux permease
MAVAFGWRTTYVVVAALPVLLAIATTWLVSPAERVIAADRVQRTGRRLPGSIWWLAGYGVLFGFAGAASLLVPLFVEEGLGQDARLGGLVAGSIGLVAVAARIWWAHLSERVGRFIEPLWAMTPLGIVGAIAFLLADDLGLWLVWPGALLLGMSTSSWNGVAMLAAMNEAGTAATGRASGVIVSGFLLGLGLGPPIYGALVDRSGGSYDPMWWASALAALATGVLVGVWQLRRRRDRAVPATP